MPNKSFNNARHVRLKGLDTSLPISKSNVSGHTGEEMIERPFIEQFGFTSHPPKDSKGIAICPNGYAEQAVILGLDSEIYKPERQEGESIMYDAFGNKVHLKDGVIEVVAATDMVMNVTGSVTINCAEASVNASSSCDVTAPEISLNGNTTMNGNVGSSGGSFSIGGGGGAAIARVGDQVQVGGSIGTIISGSSIATST